MKKLIGLLFIVALMSCEKESYCWKCNTETTGQDFYFSHIFVVCDMTYNERTDFERANSSSAGSVKTVTNCKIDE